MTNDESHQQRLTQGDKDEGLRNEIQGKLTDKALSDGEDLDTLFSQNTRR